MISAAKLIAQKLTCYHDTSGETAKCISEPKAEINFNIRKSMNRAREIEHKGKGKHRVVSKVKIYIFQTKSD